EAARPARGICAAGAVHGRKSVHECGGRSPRRRHQDGAALGGPRFIRMGPPDKDSPGEEVLLDAMAEAAREAGAAILDIVAKGFDVEQKGDLSPVTEADRAAELIILAALAKAAPGVPVIAEEEVAAGRIPVHGDTYFLVDPLDGTKEF